MRTIRYILSLTFLLGLSLLTSPVSASGATGLSVSVSVSPVPNRPDDCLFKIEITDMADDKLIAAPNVIIKKGEVGKVSVGDSATSTLVVDLTIDKAGTSATYSVTYAKNGAVVAVQKGSISIR